MSDSRRETDPLPHLETFARVAELGSFTAAGTALGLTQAAVSQRIHGLEEALGVALFQRQGGRVLLTDAGQRLYPYTQRILALHMEARAEVTGRKAPVTGELVLAASSVPGEHLLPAVLAGFRQRYPGIQVRVTVTDSVAVFNQVEQGQAQLGFVGRKTDHPHLEFQLWTTDQLVLVVPSAHSWKRRRQVSLSQLSEAPLIVREAGSGSRWCLEQALASRGKTLHDLAIALELGSNEAIKEAVLRGVGVAILSTQVVQKELDARRLHAVQIADLPLERQIFVVRDRRRVLPIPAQLFLASLTTDSEAGPRS